MSSKGHSHRLQVKKQAEYTNYRIKRWRKGGWGRSCSIWRREVYRYAMQKSVIRQKFKNESEKRGWNLSEAQYKLTKLRYEIFIELGPREIGFTVKFKNVDLRLKRRGYDGTCITPYLDVKIWIAICSRSCVQPDLRWPTSYFTSAFILAFSDWKMLKGNLKEITEATQYTKALDIIRKYW